MTERTANNGNGKFNRKRPGWGQAVKELLSYKDLLFRLVRKEFLTSYQQTLLGPFWMLINPLLTVLTFVLIFHNIIGVSTKAYLRLHITLRALLYGICFLIFSLVLLIRLPKMLMSSARCIFHGLLHHCLSCYSLSSVFCAVIISVIAVVVVLLVFHGVFKFDLVRLLLFIPVVALLH